jgi:hypothetical protein
VTYQNKVKAGRAAGMATATAGGARLAPSPGCPRGATSPMVRRPSGSTWRARSSASLFTMSWLAGETARMRQEGACRGGKWVMRGGASAGRGGGLETRLPLAEVGPTAAFHRRQCGTGVANATLSPPSQCRSALPCMTS